jgi:hypothetical protein
VVVVVAMVMVMAMVALVMMVLGQCIIPLRGLVSLAY